MGAPAAAPLGVGTGLSAWVWLALGIFGLEWLGFGLAWVWLGSVWLALGISA